MQTWVTFTNAVPVMGITGLILFFSFVCFHPLHPKRRHPVQIFGEHKDNGNNSNGKKHSECNRPATLYSAGIFKYIPPMENSRASYNADMCLYGRCSVAVRC